MKKSLCFILLVLLVLPIFSQLIIAQDSSGLPPEILEKQQKIQELRNVTRWQEIGIRTRESLLKNPVIGWIDAGLTKISWVFWLFFGMSYSLSITLLFVIALWFWVFLFGGNSIKIYWGLSTSTSLAFSGGAAVLLAHFGVFENLVNAIGILVFSPEATWARFVLILVVILFIVLFYYISSLAEKYLKFLAEKREKRETRVSREEFQAYLKGKRKARRESQEK